MHEVSLCQQLAAVVRRAAGSHTVTGIEVEVGQLRQVVPEALCYAWEFVVRGTDLDGSVVQIRPVPGILGCTACGARRPYRRDCGFSCAGCGSSQVRVVSGEEFRVVAVEIARTEESRKGMRDGAFPPP